MNRCSLPPLEAFALDCPVIAADVAGAREQLEDAACYFDPRCADQLVEQILLLKNNEALRVKKIALGKRRALSWTSKDYVAKIIEIVEEFEPIRKCWSSKDRYRHL